MRTYLRDLAPVVALRPHALIVADAGLFMLVREEMERGRWPQPAAAPVALRVDRAAALAPRRPGWPSAAYSVVKTARAACSVASISASPCAALTKPASYSAGAK